MCIRHASISIGLLFKKMTDLFEDRAETHTDYIHTGLKKVMGTNLEKAKNRLQTGYKIYKEHFFNSN